MWVYRKENEKKDFASTRPTSLRGVRISGLPNCINVVFSTRVTLPKEHTYTHTHWARIYTHISNNQHQHHVMSTLISCELLACRWMSIMVWHGRWEEWEASHIALFLIACLRLRWGFRRGLRAQVYIICARRVRWVVRDRAVSKTLFRKNNVTNTNKSIILYDITSLN